MSTTIDSISGSPLHIIATDRDEFRIELQTSRGDSVQRTYDRADLLAALRAEGILPAEPEPLAEWERELLATPDSAKCIAVPADAVVILRETLPEVYVNPTFITEEPFGSDREERPYATIALPTQSSAEDFRRLGIGYLALAEYLDAKPPVDSQVKALADVLGDFAIFDHGGRRDDDVLALRLFERGVRIEQVQA